MRSMMASSDLLSEFVDDHAILLWGRLLNIPERHSGYIEGIHSPPWSYLKGSMLRCPEVTHWIHFSLDSLVIVLNLRQTIS